MTDQMSGEFLLHVFLDSKSIYRLIRLPGASFSERLWFSERRCSLTGVALWQAFAALELCKALPSERRALRQALFSERRCSPSSRDPARSPKPGSPKPGARKQPGPGVFSACFCNCPTKFY